MRFLSTLSLRRATGKSTTLTRIAWISIHALLAESDTLARRFIGCGNNFYPRSPCGERLSALWMALSRLLFLSTLSLRRATVTTLGGSAVVRYFYPRSPCGERQKFGSAWLAPGAYFYPRSPCGERRQVKQTCRAETSISIHALLAESDGA